MAGTAVRALGLGLVLALAGGCYDTARIVKRDALPQGATIAVVGFRDCRVAGRAECAGSGAAAAEAVARAFREGGYRTTVVARPAPASQSLADEDAMLLGRGHDYVIQGVVDDFFSVDPPSSNMDRASVSMRLLRVADGETVGRFSDGRQARTNLTSPAEMVYEMAARFRDGL